MSMLLLRGLVAWLLTALCLSSPAAAQPYTPIPASLASCPSGQTAVTLGSTTLSPADGSFYYGSLSNAQLLVLSINTTGLNGATLSQLSLALGDNSRMAGPVQLTLGVYTYQLQPSSSPVTGLLVAQTAEITVYPSSAQTLYASLLYPVTLMSTAGSQYGLAVWTDGYLVAGQHGYGSGYSGYSLSHAYGDYSMPTSLSLTTYAGAGMAASGCINPNEFSGGSSAVYAFCAYSASYSPGQPNSIYSTAVSTVTSMTGLITVGKSSPTTTSFGTGYTVTGLSGSLTQSVSGSSAFNSPSISVTPHFVQLGGSKLGSPSNLLYLSGPAAVDSGGLSVTLDTGVQVLLQGSSSGAISFTASTPSAVATQSLYVSSAFVLTAETASSTSTSCLTSSYVPDPPVACPAGQVPISYGNTNPAYALNALSIFRSEVPQANVIYFSPFLATAPSTVITTLSYYVLANPGDVCHLRLGLFLINDSTATTSFVLLAESSEVTLVNIGNQLVSVNLPTPVPLTQGGNYAIGIWADQSIYSPYNVWQPAFTATIPYSSVSSTGAFPPIIAGVSSGANVPTAASGCTAGRTSQVSFCAAFNYQFATTVYTGVLTVLDTVFTNSWGSYRIVISGNGTVDQYSPWTLGGFQYLTPNYLYDPATTKSGTVLDGAGLQIVYSRGEAMTSTITVLAPASAIDGIAVFSYWESIEYTFGEAGYQGNAGANVTWAPYTGGAITCPTPATTALNLVVPASVSRLLCPASSSLLTFGDPVIFDYANYREGNAVSAGLVYTNSFTGQAGAVVSQLAVDLLSNVNSPPIGLQLGLYLASSGALLASSGPITLLQTVDQQVVVALASPVTLTAAQYYLALTANASLSIATGSAQSATMTSSGGGLPGTFTASGTTAGVVPVLALGCLPASYSFCSWFQYYTPGSTPSTSTFLYSGLLTLGSGPSSSSFGSYYSVSLASAYLSVYTRLATSTISSVTLFDTLVSPAGGSGRIYVSGVAALDLSGLQLYSASRAVTVTLSYSGNASFVDSSAAAWGAPLTSNFSVAPTGGSGGSIPQCGVLSLPTVNIGLAPAPSCPAGQTVVSFDDDVGADYGNVVEEVYYGSNSYIIMRQFTAPPSNVSSSITQLGWGLNKNFNVLGHARFALYDTNLNFLAQSNEVTFINPVDQAIVGALSPAYALTPSGVYYIAVWTDVSLYFSFSYIYVNTPCNLYQYSSGTAWPSPFVSAGDCGYAALGAYGCAAPVLTASSATSSSTGVSPEISRSGTDPSSCSGCGSSGSSLSNGAIAGLVIGCSIGVALLTAICLTLCFRGNVFGKATSAAGVTTNGNRHAAQRLDSPPQSPRVEMTHPHTFTSSPRV